MSAQTIPKGFNSCHRDNGHCSQKPRLPNFLADKNSPQLQLLAIILIEEYLSASKAKRVIAMQQT